MKICFIVPKAYPLLNKKFKKEAYGGAEVQVVSLAKNLAKREDVEISIVTGIYDDTLKQEEFDKIRVIQAIPSKGEIWYKLKKMLLLPKILKDINADYYLQRALNPFTSIFAILFKIMKKSFVYMVASDGELDGSHYMYKKFYLKILIGCSFRLPSLVICQNDFEREMLTNKYGVKRIDLLRKGMNTKPFRFNKECLYDAIWIGRTTPRKRTDLYIDLAKDNPDKKFLMLCIPALEIDTYTKEVEEANKKYPNLQVLFSVEHAQVLEYIKDSKLHVSTSEVEGDLSMTTLEASQWSVPTLSMYLDHNLLVQKYKGGVYCKGDYLTMNKELKKICEKEDYRLALSKGAHKTIEKHYNMEKNIVKLIDSLKKI